MSGRSSKDTRMSKTFIKTPAQLETAFFATLRGPLPSSSSSSSSTSSDSAIQWPSYTSKEARALRNELGPDIKEQPKKAPPSLRDNRRVILDGFHRPCPKCEREKGSFVEMNGAFWFITNTSQVLTNCPSRVSNECAAVHIWLGG